MRQQRPQEDTVQMCTCATCCNDTIQTIETTTYEHSINTQIIKDSCILLCKYIKYSWLQQNLFCVHIYSYVLITSCANQLLLLCWRYFSVVHLQPLGGTVFVVLQIRGQRLNKYHLEVAECGGVMSLLRCLSSILDLNVDCLATGGPSK